MQKPYGNALAAAVLEIDVEMLGADFAGAAGPRRQKRGTAAGDKIGKAQAARTDLRKVIVEPVGERCVHIRDVAILIAGEETGGRMIEEIDRVLQFLEHVFVALALTRDIGHRPK